MAFRIVELGFFLRNFCFWTSYKAIFLSKLSLNKPFLSYLFVNIVLIHPI